MAVSISKRGDVEPFHAMDILAEANRLKALGHAGRVDGGRPAVRSGAAAGARSCGAGRWQIGRIGYTDALGLADAAPGDRRALCATITGWTFRPAASP